MYIKELTLGLRTEMIIWSGEGGVELDLYCKGTGHFLVSTRCCHVCEGSGTAT